MAIIDMTITVSGQKVIGNLHTPNDKPKNVGVLLLHGWTGRPNEDAAEFLARHGYATITISMRGHGNSDGDIKLICAKNSLDDAIVAYDVLASKLPYNSPIVVVGNSYGAYIAVLLSGVRGVRALSLRVPAIYPDGQLEKPKWGKGHEDPAINKWRNRSCNFSDNEALKLLHDFAGKIQIIEAEKDEIIPHQTIENYKNSVASSSQLTYNYMKDWKHSIGKNPEIAEQFGGVLLDWLKSSIS
jgi:uncharacterized protein